MPDHNKQKLTKSTGRFHQYAGKCGENVDQNNSEYGLFLCSVKNKNFLIYGGLH